MNQNLDKLKVTADNILIKELKSEIKHEGLVEPTTYEEKTDWGEVIFVGEKSQLKIGSRVFFNRYCTVSLQLPNGVKYLTLKDEDVIAYVKPEDIKEFWVR